ncbi:1107_t:CDS:2 [Entrophospora sp. SA101]|nr:1107_t:CDS:2 [Entrophospora sp. SA101]
MPPHVLEELSTPAGKSEAKTAIVNNPITKNLPTMNILNKGRSDITSNVQRKLYQQHR